MKQPGRRRYQLPDPRLNELVESLVGAAQESFGESADAEYVRQILVTGLQLVRDRPRGGDAKLLCAALKEMRHAFRVFAPYANVRKVAVFGSARTKAGHAEWEAAQAFAREIVSRGWMVITGAGDGIMGAAQGGAGRKRSFGVNIRLPFEQQANETIKDDHKLVNFRYFFTRKVTFVKESHAVVLFPGGFGTHDEGYEALTLVQTGKSEMVPVVFVDAPGGSYWKDWETYVHTHLKARGLISADDTALFKVTDDVQRAVREITNFYSNYHSSRYVRDLLVLRVRKAPDGEQLARLNRDFGDILAQGAIEVSEALPEENGEFLGHPRVTLAFNRRSQGRLRLLIDRLNELVPGTACPPTEAVPHQIVPEKLSSEAEVAEQE